MDDKMEYGITKLDHIFAQQIITQTAKYPSEHHIVIQNQKVTLDRLSKRMLINPENYLSEFLNRLYSLEKYSLDRGLQEIMVTLTSGKKGSIQIILKDLAKQFRQLTQLTAWAHIRKEFRTYIRIVEPQESGRPHYHILFWIPKVNVESFFDALLKKFRKPQIDIISEYIPSKYRYKEKAYKKEKTWHSGYKKDDIRGYVRKSNKSMLKYFEKNVFKVTDDLKSDEDITDLTVWYVMEKMKIFAMSRTLVPIEIYRKLNGSFSLADLTTLINNREIEVWKSTKKHKQLQLITHGETILWEKGNYVVYALGCKNDGIDKNRKQYLPQDIDFTNPLLNFLHYGSLKTILDQHGMKKYLITNFMKAEQYSNDNIIEDLDSAKIKQATMLSKESLVGIDEINNKYIGVQGDLAEIFIKIESKIQNTQLDMVDKFFKGIETIQQGVEQLDKKSNVSMDQSVYIGVAELEKRYDIKERSQKSYRGRIKDKLPYYQVIENGKISYKVSEIEEWMSKFKQ